MNKTEFMRQLDILLVGLPIHEREEALQYYEDYFADAGEENEQEVIAALGSPKAVAENIKKDLSQSRGYEELAERYVEPGREMVKYQQEEENASNQGAYRETPTEEKKGGLSGGIIALIVVLCILASPILLGILGALIGVGAAWISLVVTFGVVAAVLVIVAVVLAVSGVIGIVHNPLAGIGVIGCGLLMAAAGILFLMLCVLLAWGIPALIGAVVRLCRGKKKAA